MQDARSVVAVIAITIALLGLGMLDPSRAEAQAVGFAPTVGSFPDGVSLNAVPVVSADRRYVRLGLQADFSTINGFHNFPVPAAVGGGGNGGSRGFASFMNGAGDFADWGAPYSPDYLANRPGKLTRGKPTRSKKPLADPVIVPIKKPEPARGGGDRPKR